MGRVKILVALALAAASASDGVAGAFEDIPYEPVISENPAFLRGMTYFPRKEPLSALPNQAKNLDLMLATGVEWVALVPVWYQQTRTSTLIGPAKGKTAPDESVRQVIRYLHAKGAKVMLKPYVDSHDGVWRANFEPKNADTWFSSYRRFVNHYAEMAADEDVEMLCVGVEYSWCDKNRREQWLDVIDSARARYGGPLTYAAHWRVYQDVCFWDAVDYVGVNAYFALSKKDDVGLSTMVKAWAGPLDEMGSWRYRARLTDKEVIFTEVGYRSLPLCWKKGIVTETDEVDTKAQEVCYKALFMTAPGRRWLRGIFIWCWDNWSPDAGGGPDNNNWTPKRKPAEKVLSDYYHSY
ncbi:MAG TPA: hypothetical protein VMX79_12380 [bacterium]|nr:hypothetical protein [bacterium]